MSAGGISTPRQLAQWPALADMGISQTAFTMNGCAIRPPHTHMKATGLLYVISGMAFPSPLPCTDVKSIPCTLHIA